MTKNKNMALFGLSLASFAVVLELPMIFTILPSIKLDIYPTLTYLHWIMVIYILAISISLVTIWRLSDLIGRRWVLYIGLVVFGFSSLFCALAQSSGALILFRGFEGLGAAMILPNTISLLKSMYQTKDIDQPIKCWLSSNILAFVIAPVVGGLLIKFFNWQSGFYLLAILSAISLFICFFSISKESVDKKIRDNFDIFGGVIFSIFLTSLSIAIVQGPTWGWGSLLSILCFIIASVSGVAFISQEWRLKTPIVDLKMLKNRFYRASMYASVAIATYLYGGLFLIPAYLNILQGYSVLDIGFLLLSVTAVAAGSQPLTRSLMRIFNHKLLLLFGLFLMIVSLCLQSNYQKHSDLKMILIGLLFMGLSLGILWRVCRGIVNDLFKNSKKVHLLTETLWTWKSAAATVGLAIMGAIFRQSQHSQLSLLLSQNKINLSLYQHQVLTNYFQNNSQIKSLFTNNNLIQNQDLVNKIINIYQSSFDHAYVRSMEFALGLSLFAFISIVVIKMFKK